MVYPCARYALGGWGEREGAWGEGGVNMTLLLHHTYPPLLLTSLATPDRRPNNVRRTLRMRTPHQRSQRILRRRSSSGHAPSCVVGCGGCCGLASRREWDDVDGGCGQPVRKVAGPRRASGMMLTTPLFLYCCLPSKRESLPMTSLSYSKEVPTPWGRTA